METTFQAMGLSEAAAGELAAACFPKTISRGEFFVRAGGRNQELAWVEAGYFQYVVTQDGEERTTYSVGAGQWLASLRSYFLGVAAEESIRALVDSNVWLLPKEPFDQLRSRFPEIQHLYVHLLEHQICCIDESRLQSILWTPEQRYLHYLQSSPELFQHLPLQELASIIGITPRHLSRIRKKIL